MTTKTTKAPPAAPGHRAPTTRQQPAEIPSWRRKPSGVLTRAMLCQAVFAVRHQRLAG